MSLTMYGGPADGQEFACSRAPSLLRVVLARTRWDCLDQLDDEPRPRETIHLYEQLWNGGGAFICPGGYTVSASYRYIITCHGELDEAVRERASWRRFVADYFGVTLGANGERIADVVPIAHGTGRSARALEV